MLLQNITTLDKINYLNIFLMLVSLASSFYYPFETFLLFYIFVGPLHYLTELSWLEKKQFFLFNKKHVLLLLCSIIFFAVVLFFPNPAFNNYVNSLLFSSLVLAMAMVLTRNIFVQLAVFVLSFLLVFAMQWHQQDWFLIVFSIFLPTIIHISVFTGLFMLSGILKNKSFSGWLMMASFAFCSCFFFVFNYRLSGYMASAQIQDLYYDFTVLNKKFSDFFHFGQFNQMLDIFTSKEGIIIMQFIAFSYAYHYLNWFTKTSIIKWHEVSKLRMAILLALYVIFIGIYFYNKILGGSLIAILGISHIILEFPLNVLSLKSIFVRK